MEVEKLSNFPKKCNPYNYDNVRMGQSINTHDKVFGWTIMYNDNPNEIIIVDTISGERLKIIRNKTQWR